jgi:APA family basic amino acid/polyamine antiporter
MASTAQPLGPTALIRGVRRWDLVALMINCIIGAGIFGLPSQIYSLTGTYSLLAFAACALLVALLAVCYAEVSSRFTETGGPYLYAAEAFGPLIGFQVGWIAVLARLGSLAFVSNVLVNYFSFFWPAAGERFWRTMIIIGLFAVLTGINLIGVRQTALASDVLTVGKLAPILLFIAAGLFFLDTHSFSFAVRPSLGTFSMAVSQLVFAFTGFELGSIATGEARDPRRNMPFAILTALGVVVLLYILIQVVCIGTLPGLASSQKPIADASRRFLGTAGASIITAGVVVSALGNLNAILLAGPRLLFAMAQRGVLPRIFAYVHPRFRTPSAAILVVAALGLALACTGTFRYTLTLTAISKLITFIAASAALPVLRRRAGATPALVRIPGGVTLSIIGVALCAWLIAHSGWREARDVAVVSVAGFVVYFLSQTRRSKPNLSQRALGSHRAGKC